MKVLPATLGASDEHYRRLGLSRSQIELWEDGMRTEGGPGTYEWWYFDAYLTDGSKLAITFRTKPIVDVGKPLDPWIDFNLDRADGTSVVKHPHVKPEQFAASKEICDVVMGSNTFKGDLHTYSIHVEIEGMVVDVSLTGTTPAWRPQTGCLFFGERDVAIEPDTGKPVASQMIYEYTDGAERYVLTFTREKDTLHYKFIEELQGLKAMLARLVRVDGAYLRFTGGLKLEHYHADQLVESEQDEALWELMYFGHVPRK